MNERRFVPLYLIYEWEVGLEPLTLVELLKFIKLNEWWLNFHLWNFNWATRANTYVEWMEVGFTLLGFWLNNNSFHVVWIMGKFVPLDLLLSYKSQGLSYLLILFYFIYLLLFSYLSTHAKMGVRHSPGYFVPKCLVHTCHHSLI
jgi:hypothetical protein